MDPSKHRFEFSSDLRADPAEVWRHAVSPKGVNREFRPFLRMTFPLDVQDLTAGSQPGVRRFRSWMLFAGILPVEYDDVVFDEVEPGHRFLERSTLLSQRLWEHERIVEPTANGCRIIDRLHYEPRWSWLGGLHGPLFRATFWWRHRNLRAIFGAASPT